MATNAMGTARHEDLVSALVNTYRELNVHVRPLPESTLTAPRGEGSVRDLVARMRRDEMRFSQALKQRVTGVVIGDPDDDERLAAEAIKDASTAQLISQFGTARETTLSLLESLTTEDWNRATDDGKSILQHVQELTQSDHAQLERIKSMLT